MKNQTTEIRHPIDVEKAGLVAPNWAVSVFCHKLFTIYRANMLAFGQFAGISG
jgi:hypothetical protein